MLRLDLAEQMFNVVEDGDEHLVLGDANRWRVPILVGTVVNDAIHVELPRSSSAVIRGPDSTSGTYVETVELWYPVLRD